MKKAAAKFIVSLFLPVVGLLAWTAVSYADEPFTKLGRGVANTLTGWIELPKTIYAKSVEDNAFTGMTLGVAEGAGMSIVRTGAGIFEIATFPFPLPEDYKPVMEPEYVF